MQFAAKPDYMKEADKPDPVEGFPGVYILQ